MAATSATRATRSASSSTWTSVRRTAGGSTTSSRRGRSSSGSRPSARSSRRRRTTAARSRSGGATPTAAADRDRHRLGHAAVLRRLHAAADLGRGPALHVPLRPPRPRPARAHPRRRLDEELQEALTAIWGKRTDRYSERRSEARSPAEGRDELHRWLSTRSSRSPFSAAALELADAIELDVPRGQSRASLPPRRARSPPARSGRPARAVERRRRRPRGARRRGGPARARLSAGAALPRPRRVDHRGARGRRAAARGDGRGRTRVERGPALGRAAAPALAVDLELLKDEGYRYVATFPPEGSEGSTSSGRRPPG